MGAIGSQPPELQTESVSQLVELYWERAYRFAAMLTRNDQESVDVAQEALLRVLSHADRFDPARGPFETWLWTIVLNTARDAGRASGRRVALLDRLYRQPVRDSGDPEDLAIRRLGDDELLAAVWRLPKRQRTLVALRFGAGLSYREIGHQLGLSEAAALMAVRRALTRLRHELQHREAHS
jgi:RNA polymerase sigma-70 factor (ECF subfamily)